MGKLHDAQATFTSMVAELIKQAQKLGFTPVLDYARRCRECPIGSQNSLHRDRLAVDLLLFRNGEYLKATYHYEDLGLWWEELGGCWGGRFKPRADGNHFSLEYNGRR